MMIFGNLFSTYSLIFNTKKVNDNYKDFRSSETKDHLVSYKNKKSKYIFEQYNHDKIKVVNFNFGFCNKLPKKI